MSNLKFKTERFLVATILLVTFLVFSPVLTSDFVNWDDDVNVTLNPNVQALNAATVKNMFTHSIIGGYTPLTTLSFAVENQIFGMKPGVFHFNNLLLHLLCTLLVFVFMRKLGMNPFISLVVMFLFGIHPMRVESVAWITERKDLLYSFFFLLSLIFYISFYKSRRFVFYFLALAAFIFALLSKIQAVTLPLVLLLIDYYSGDKIRFKQILDKIPFFILSVVIGLAGIYFLGQKGTLEANSVLPFFQRIFIGTYSFCVYLIKAVLPYQLSAIYTNPVKLSVLFYASALMVILLGLLIYKSGKYRKDLIFGSLFFLVNVVFVLQVVGTGQTFIADRFTYLAFIGLFFLIARALHIFYISKWKTYVLVSGAIYLAVLGAVTWNRTRVWKNSETLFSDVIRKYPKSSIAYNNLGLYYREKNQNEKAIAAYGKSIEINPSGYLSYNNRGETYFDLGMVDHALEDMNQAIKLKPDYGKALSNRGAALGSKKQYELAQIDLDKAISLDAGNLKAWSNRALVYYSLGNFEKASQDLTSCLLIKPDDTDILNLRALCFGRLNKNQEALADFNKSIRINPKAGAYYQNRSYLFYKLGDSQAALRDILKAQELGRKADPAYIQKLRSK